MTIRPFLPFPFGFFASYLVHYPHLRPPVSFLFVLNGLSRVFFIYMDSHRLDDKYVMVSSGASSGDHQRVRCDPPTIIMVLYIEQFGGRLDGRSSSAMRLPGDLCESSAFRSKCLRDAAVSAWIKWWWH